jgi:glycosyltransferase involved in cell wall biosynthesis
VLRHLAASGHDVILASFTRPEEERHIPAVREICMDVFTVPLHRSRLADIGYWLKSFVTRRPFLIERDDLKAMHSCVQEIISTIGVDCIHADQLSMTQFAMAHLAKSGDPLLVFDAHNAVWTIVDRMSHNVSWLLRPVLKIEARRVKRYEGQIVNTFDHTLAVTEIDREYLLEARGIFRNGQGPEKTDNHPKVADTISVIPIAVDTELLQPVSREQSSKNLFTMGSLHYPPNADGIRWFAQEVFPLIRARVPEVTLTIAGRNPPSDFNRIAQDSGGAIKVMGYVPELKPFLEKSSLMVVPVRAGSGMRVRILEAFAQAMPVVTTSVGLEGIDAIPGEEVLVADTPEDFAESVTRLLKDEELQARLAFNGRRLAECCYDWKVVLKSMDKIYDRK